MFSRMPGGIAWSPSAIRSEATGWKRPRAIPSNGRSDRTRFFGIATWTGATTACYFPSGPMPPRRILRVRPLISAITFALRHRRRQAPFNSFIVLSDTDGTLMSSRQERTTGRRKRRKTEMPSPRNTEGDNAKKKTTPRLELLYFFHAAKARAGMKFEFHKHERKNGCRCNSNFMPVEFRLHRSVFFNKPYLSDNKPYTKRAS